MQHSIWLTNSFTKWYCCSIIQIHNACLCTTANKRKRQVVATAYTAGVHYLFDPVTCYNWGFSCIFFLRLWNVYVYTNIFNVKQKFGLQILKCAHVLIRKQTKGSYILIRTRQVCSTIAVWVYRFTRARSDSKQKGSLYDNSGKYD